MKPLHATPSSIRYTPWIRAALITLAPLCAIQSAEAGVAGPGIEKEIGAEFTETAPIIDGSLSDAIWQSVPTDDRFTQHFPRDGKPPSMRTTVQVAFDNDTLFFAINAIDPEPDKISARVSKRDSRVASDFVEIFLDTRHGHDAGYWFRINAAGVLADGEIHDDTRINFEWDAVWTGKALVHGSGWSAELAIPLSVLRFANKNTPVFGFNVTRGVRRSGEIIQWTHIPRNRTGTLSRAGHIAGLDGVKPQRAIELRPFGVIRMDTQLNAGGSFAFGSAQSTGDLTGGVDAKIGLSEGLTLDATINPDFGQVEADAVVLNLSTFETFFPEKRPFFLEGAGLLGTDIRLIHSRRIGQRTTSFGPGSELRDLDGSVSEVRSAPASVPIYAAARISGSVGPHFSINALNAVTGPERVEVNDGYDARQVEVAPPRNYTAARGKYSLGGSSYLGFVATSVARLGSSLDPEANHDAFSESIDGRWVRSDGAFRAYYQLATTQRNGGDKYEVGDRNCQTSNCRPFTRPDGTIQRPGDVGYAGEFGGAKNSGALRFYSRYRFVSPLFDADDIGFENDWDFHQLVGHSAYYYEKSFSRFQRGQAELNASADFGFDGTRKRLEMSTRLFALTNGFWSADLTLEYQPPGSFTTRETSDGARFEKSDFIRADLGFETDSRRDYSGGFGAEALSSPGTELALGTAFAYTTLRPTSRFELHVQTDVEVRNDDLRAIQCTDTGPSVDRGPCWRRSQVRDYVLALQDSRSLNMTARASLAISTDLSLEGYLQMFAASGSLDDYRAIYGQRGAAPKLSRGEEIRIPFDGDSDGDGEPDDRFSFATLNANFVLRWELFPGTTMIAVYTRAQRHSRERDRLAFAGLRRSQGEEIFLVKVTLFAGL